MGVLDVHVVFAAGNRALKPLGLALAALLLGRAHGVRRLVGASASSKGGGWGGGRSWYEVTESLRRALRLQRLPQARPRSLAPRRCCTTTERRRQSAAPRPPQRPPQRHPAPARCQPELQRPRWLAERAREDRGAVATLRTEREKDPRLTERQT
jgi:hypothetical protein